MSAPDTRTNQWRRRQFGGSHSPMQKVVVVSGQPGTLTVAVCCPVCVAGIVFVELSVSGLGPEPESTVLLSARRSTFDKGAPVGDVTTASTSTVRSELPKLQGPTSTVIATDGQHAGTVTGIGTGGQFDGCEIVITAVY